MTSYRLGFSHSDVSISENENCRKMIRKKRSQKGLMSLYSRVKPGTAVDRLDTFLTIRSEQANKPQTEILGGSFSSLLHYFRVQRFSSIIQC